MNENLSGNILSGLDGIVTVAGVNNQTCIITGDKKQKKYNLTYEPIEINSIKAYFLVHLTFEDGTVNTYFLPIQFLGIQSVVFEVPLQVATMQFYIYGNLKLKDTSLKSVITDALTEEQKEALNKVTTNSEYWDRILAITNNLGNVITGKLEGSINTAINTITNSSGQMYWEDGKFICRDGSTDEVSTMAMMISPGGFMIADSKKNNGDWDWRTFGTGKGFTADEIIAGTLEAIAIRGVTITGSVITGGEVIGAIIKGGSLNINDRFIVDSDGDVQMSGEITWGADNSPVKVKYSSDNLNWHYDYQSNDIFAKYSYDGGLTWTEGIKIKGTDGEQGDPGIQGPIGEVGPQGPQGPAGSDANVPDYIKSTYIDSVEIKSPTITGNVINGAIIKGGTLSGNTITGGTITGETVFATNAVVTGLEVGKNVKMGAGARIEWDNVDNRPNTTKIDANGIYTGTVNATNISGGTLKGVTIEATKDFRIMDSDGYNTVLNYHPSNSPQRVYISKMTESTQQFLAPKITAKGSYSERTEMTQSQICVYNSSRTTTPDVKLTSNSYGGDITIGYGSTNISRIYRESAGAVFELYNSSGQNYFKDRYYNSRADIQAPYGIQITSGGSNFILTNNNGEVKIDASGGLNISRGGLKTTGTKNAIVNTKNYGKRLLYCEESDRLYFNTKGIAETHLTADGKSQFIIRLDDIFLETIELNSVCPYIVNLTPYARTMIWVKEVYDKYIIIESDEPIRFAYNIQCTRIDYKDTYLEEFERVI